VTRYCIVAVVSTSGEFLFPIHALISSLDSSSFVARPHGWRGVDAKAATDTRIATQDPRTATTMTNRRHHRMVPRLPLPLTPPRPTPTQPPTSLVRAGVRCTGNQIGGTGTASPMNDHGGYGIMSMVGTVLGGESSWLVGHCFSCSRCPSLHGPFTCYCAM